MAVGWAVPSDEYSYPAGGKNVLPDGRPNVLRTGDERVVASGGEWQVRWPVGLGGFGPNVGPTELLKNH